MSRGVRDAWPKGSVEIGTNTLRFVHVRLGSAENTATPYGRYKVVLKVRSSSAMFGEVREQLKRLLTVGIRWYLRFVQVRLGSARFGD